MCSPHDEDRASTAGINHERAKIMATPAERERTIEDHFIQLEADLARRLQNLHRLRGAMSRDALRLPASTLL